MLRCAFSIAPSRYTAALEFHRTLFSPARGPTCARCAWRMVPTKCMPKPSPNTNSPSGDRSRREPRNLDRMPPTQIDNVRALMDFVGREVGISEWHAITQDQIRQFADVTRDHQWIHLDHERAQRESPF